ncbi:MAG: MFS transporter [Pseudomonadota bacterium]
MSDPAKSSGPATLWGGVAFGLALAAFAAFQQFKLPPVLPVMLEAYDYDLVVAGGFMSIYALMGLLFSLPVSRLINRQGPLPALWGALGLFLAGNLLVLVFPQSGWLVLACRALEGLGFTVMALVGPASANAAAARHHLPLVFALTAMWIPTGQFAAALVALPTQDAGLWRPVWYVSIALTVGLAFWLIQRRGRGLAIGGPGKNARALTAEERRLLWVAGIAFLIFSGQFIGYMTWFPAYMVTSLGFTPAAAIYAYLVPVVLVAAFNLVSARLMNRGWTPARLLIIGFIMETACWALLPVAGEGLFGLILLIVYGAGAGLVPAGLFAMPSTIVGQGGPAMAAFGLIMTLRNLGVLAGPLLLAVLIEPDGGWGLAAPAFAVITGIALPLCLWLSRQLNRRTAEGELST